MLLQSVNGEGTDDHESTVSDAASSGIPMFQTQLMQFLDNKAPVLGCNSLSFPYGFWRVLSATLDEKNAFDSLALNTSDSLTSGIIVDNDCERCLRKRVQRLKKQKCRDFWIFKIRK